MSYRMWIIETDKYGMTDKKFFIDNPSRVPAVGEFIDGDDAGGWVELVQSYYGNDPDMLGEEHLVVNVYLTKEKPKK
jgi:hypothetical protein